VQEGTSREARDKTGENYEAGASGVYCNGNELDSEIVADLERLVYELSYPAREKTSGIAKGVGYLSPEQLYTIPR
jgi:hypothetical protein